MELLLYWLFAKLLEQACLSYALCHNLADQTNHIMVLHGGTQITDSHPGWQQSCLLNLVMIDLCQTQLFQTQYSSMPNTIIQYFKQSNTVFQTQ